MENNCNCEVCQYGRKVKHHLDLIPEEQREFFDDMYLRWCCVEEDLSISEGVIEGTWPSADETIIDARKRTGIALPIIRENV